MADCLLNDRDLSVRPAVCSDFAALPFADATFERIYWDPPHMIRRDGWSSKYERDWRGFKCWSTHEEWVAALRAVNIEFSRVAKPDGTLVTKLLDGKDRRVTKTADAYLELSAWTLIKEERRASKTPWSTAEVVFSTFSIAPHSARKEG